MNDRPIWIVDLVYKRPGYVKEKRDVKYVRAATEAGAVKTAKFHSILPNTCDAYPRLAKPQDLL